jgi:hypothetical protein
LSFSIASLFNFNLFYLIIIFFRTQVIIFLNSVKAAVNLKPHEISTIFSLSNILEDNKTGYLRFVVESSPNCPKSFNPHENNLFSLKIIILNLF